MAAFTDFAENKLIDWIFRGQPIGFNGASTGVGPANLYVGLLTGNPTDSTAGTEVSTTLTGYTRVAVLSSLGNWAGTQAANSTTASSGNTGTTSNNNPITFPVPSATWGLVTGVGIFDTATGVNLLAYSALTASKTINTGDTVSFPAASLTFQIDN